MALLIKPINQFTLQKTDTPDGSFFGFDWWDGTDWQTVKILAEDLAAALTANVENFVSHDLSGVASRIHNFNDYNLAIIKCGQIRLETGSAPPSGEPSVKVVGYGNTSGDVSFEFNTGLGNALKIFGDKLANFTGQVSIGTPLASNYALEVNNSDFAGGGYFTASGLCLSSLSTTGLGGQFQGVSGIAAYSTSGNAILGQSISGGLGGKFEGGAYVETYGFGGSPNASAAFEVASTTKGALIPRMTTTQRDAISSPATSLLIYNTTTTRFEFYNGTYFRGLTMRFLPIQFSSWSPTDAQTVAFGSHPFIPVQATVSPAPFEIVMRGNGVIRGCDLNTYASGVAGSNEAWSLYVRHNGTDYLVQTQSLSTANRVFTNQSLNIPFVDGDIVRMILINPTWATNPTNVAAAGSLNIQ